MTPEHAVAEWTGSYVAESVGIVVHSSAERSLVDVRRLVGLALRENPKRAQLLVSTVLAKHVPTVPGLAIVAGELLGLLVTAALGNRAVDVSLFERLDQLLSAPGELNEASRVALRSLRDDVALVRSAHPDSTHPDSAHPDLVAIGYAETATGLGQLVAGGIGSSYVHSTRHDEPGVRFVGFEEEHSHASSHRFYPTDGTWLKPNGTVVLVDDEISTGTTIINTIRALHAAEPQSRWVVAALIDLRSATDRARLDALADELGTDITVVALGTGSIDLPPDVMQRAQRVIGAARRASSTTPTRTPTITQNEATLGDVRVVEVDVAPIRSARFGADGSIDAASVANIAAGIRSSLAALAALAAGDIVVLGSEEFIALPLLVADQLDHDFPSDARRVLFSTTTRSPIAPIDRPDYAIASAVSFRSHDLTLDGFGERFSYNLTRAGRRFGAIVLMPEPGVDPERLLADGGVVESLRRATDLVVVVLLPASVPMTDDWMLPQ